MKKIFFILSFISTTSFAAICEITIERTACPGKEKDSYVKCGGKASCSSKKKADSEAACKKLGEDECPNSRLDITKSKVIKVSYDKGATSANLCAPDRPDFNKCK